MSISPTQDDHARAAPPCPEKCRAAHTIAQAMALLSVSRSKLYELMNIKVIDFKQTHYGRRIMHAEIDRYLDDCQPKDTGGRVRTESSSRPA